MTVCIGWCSLVKRMAPKVFEMTLFVFISEGVKSDDSSQWWIKLVLFQQCCCSFETEKILVFIQLISLIRHLPTSMMGAYLLWVVVSIVVFWCVASRLGMTSSIYGYVLDIQVETMLKHAETNFGTARYNGSPDRRRNNFQSFAFAGSFVWKRLGYPKKQWLIMIHD